MIKRWGDLAIGVLLGLLSAGLILLVSKPRPGRAILLRPPPTALPIVINLDGAVAEPGVYALPARSRVIDAVEAAGGFSDAASPGSVNLAALLQDGDHIFIPALIAPAGESGEEQVLGLSSSGEVIPLVNINQASLEVLMTLPGIGPVTAERIIHYREEQAFTRIEDIQKVPGIGPATFEQIKPFLTIGQ